jgi:hypothetical protein
MSEIGPGSTPGREANVTNTVCANVRNKTLSNFVTSSCISTYLPHVTFTTESIFFSSF